MIIPRYFVDSDGVIVELGRVRSGLVIFLLLCAKSISSFVSYRLSISVSPRRVPARHHFCLACNQPTSIVAVTFLCTTLALNFESTSTCNVADFMTEHLAPPSAYSMVYMND